MDDITFTQVLWYLGLYCIHTYRRTWCNLCAPSVGAACSQTHAWSDAALWCATPPKQQVSGGEALLIAPSQTLGKQTYPRLKEWMADLTGCYCSLQTTLRKEIQECERQLRWWSLFGFLDANVTLAAPSAEPLSTFHFSDSKLPTSNCIVPNVLPVIRAESVFPLYLTDTLCTRNLFAPPFFPSVSQPGSASSLLNSSPAFLSTCCVPLVHPSSLDFFTSGYK